MAIRTLITPYEVVLLSPESNKFPPQWTEPHIYSKEQTLRRVYLGKDFYDALLDDLVDFGVVGKWDVSTTYASGDYVDYFGTTLQSIQADNTTQPCDDPENAYWIEPDKFETGCYQLLWEQYLGPYLANYIMAASIEHPTYPTGAKGTTEWTDDAEMRQGAGVRSASQAVLSSRVKKLQNDANEILQNMQEWIKDQNDAGTCDFSAALICQSQNPTPRKSRIAYRSRYGTY